MKFLHVDDHTLFRDGFSMLVAHAFPGFHLSQASHLAQALQILDEQPDIRLVLLDLNLPDSRGLASLQRLREAAPDVMAVVLSADERRETVLGAIDAGAFGFIPKSTQVDVVRAALQKVLNGSMYLPPSVVERREPEQSPPWHMLSPRQADVLRLLLQGRANKAISRELDMSESTVKTHLVAIFRKLGVNTRSEAMVAAARLGWHSQAQLDQPVAEGDSVLPEIS